MFVHISCFRFFFFIKNPFWITLHIFTLFYDQWMLLNMWTMTILIRNCPGWPTLISIFRSVWNTSMNWCFMGIENQVIDITFTLQGCYRISKRGVTNISVNCKFYCCLLHYKQISKTPYNQWCWFYIIQFKCFLVLSKKKWCNSHIQCILFLKQTILLIFFYRQFNDMLSYQLFYSVTPGLSFYDFESILLVVVTKTNYLCFPEPFKS